LTAPFALDRGRIRLDDAVLVYLERTLVPVAPLPPGEVPSAYGLAPAAVVAGAVVAAVATGEAVWLGFQAVDPQRPATVRVRIDACEPRDALTGGPWEDWLTDEPRNHLVCPPDSRLGIIDASELTALCCAPKVAHASIRLVAPDEFTRLTGEVPEPLNTDIGYKGWRLP
jgi:hypothetical protein